jgi:hypothetical protein
LDLSWGPDAGPRLGDKEQFLRLGLDLGPCECFGDNVSRMHGDV